MRQMNNKNILKIMILQIMFVVSVIIAAVTIRVPVFASSPTDEILDYKITVDVNDDATLNIRYDISWLVLESDSLGPVTWVQVGIPNSHNISYDALSDNISSMSLKNSGGNYAVINFDGSYYEGEQIDFSFEITQDYMYLVNATEEGYTTYTFTPGWFDDIRVDDLEIRWQADNIYSFSPECFVEEGYNTWQTWLEPGGKYTVKVTYPNDAFGFDLSKTSDDSEAQDDSIAYKIGEIIGGILIAVFCILFTAGPFIIVMVVIIAVRKSYNANSGFGTQTTKKITRTKIEYYPVCQGCGATRPEGTDKCVYCGRSFIKSQETVTEDQIPENEKDVLKHQTNGTYAFAHSPNTYMRVNVINIPKPRPATSSRSSGSSHHSSCAHSSCACACACACAGGGRAGCTNKDFYNTDLKLSYLEKYKNKIVL